MTAASPARASSESARTPGPNPTLTLLVRLRRPSLAPPTAPTHALPLLLASTCVLGRRRRRTPHEPTPPAAFDLDAAATDAQGPPRRAQGSTPHESAAGSHPSEKTSMPLASSTSLQNVECIRILPLVRAHPAPNATIHPGQAWLNGKKSIADPQFNDGADRFPLWTLTFWIEMTARKKSQDNDTAHVIDRAHVELVTMGWNVPLTYGRQSISTPDLREFPGTVWLTTNNVDIMMEDLAERVVSDPELADRVIVAPLAFTNASEIKEKKKEKIVFPANGGNCHWIAGVIDFPNNSMDFGDMKPNCFQPPVILIKGLQRWLQKQFSDNFTGP
ncbi:hypothetical protein K438DRAFT_2003182 [Mycena galopus ATCC 62051]|nr:hypothetical protein K438DRAFT_2003182 [Mycena galopus ATCC 62051]